MPKNQDIILLKNISPVVQMPVRWKEYEIRGWRPEAREGATFTTLFVTGGVHGESEERAYLFGGLSRDLHSAIAYLTFDISKCNLN